MNEIGFIGLGKMGSNMVSRMLENHGIRVVVWNRSREPVEKVVQKGAVASESVEELVSKLENDKKIVWLMLPSGKVTEDMFQKVIGLLSAGDIIIDGANSNFHDTLRRHKIAEEKGIQMLDVGVSGGIIAAKRGYPMMIGGGEETYKYCLPIFESLGIKQGFGRVGEGGAGHYVKMVHNAIEYGMMQSIAEGFDLLSNGSIKGLDLPKIAKQWNHGTIISSFLMEMTANAFEKDQSLNYLPVVADSGEGKWAAEDAIKNSVPFVSNTYALHARFASQDKNSIAMRLLAAMRNEFGGHEIKRNDNQ